uniref:Mg_chelatase_C domain-containing protein n=1 Tax=Ascaris lumbricoides TaxID=6252 RepID=A0A0M3I9F8_ASCLU
MVLAESCLRNAIISLSQRLEPEKIHQTAIKIIRIRSANYRSLTQDHNC